MRVWRVARAKYAESIATGRGAALAGGRWNPIGMPALYCSETSSLAILETLVHRPEVEESPTFLLLDLDVPDELIVPLSRVAVLPLAPTPATCQKAGEAALKRHLAFSVPSFVNPVEHNVVVNPLHDSFAEVRIGTPHLSWFDPRLFPPAEAPPVPR